MCGRQLAFYRSHVTQVAFILTGAYMAYAFSPWGPTEWRNTPSLRWLHHGLPWPLLSAGFAAYVLLLCVGTVGVTLVADLLGLFMYLLGLVAMFATLHLSHKSNPFAISALLLACVLHYGAARLATYQRERS